ncbi:hypothetical protein GCM10023153_10100 [Ornithinibacter aureus]|uniref:Uncharacterized protein n=1 Tax=Ornithinibacter aureus TaxID=622664 RepID=A0ABP8JJF4_9MICO|nr:hypothetical protein [Ornithinibacter aureus]KAF0833810.1 hypothetical protein C8E84_1608 [Ornithinibacter aureus]
MEAVDGGAEASDEGLDAADREPWLAPTEYSIGGIRWLWGAVGELQRALHPLLAQIPRTELADRGPAPLAAGEVPPKEASSLYRPVTVRHEWTVSIQDVVDFQIDQFLADLYGLADDTGTQMVRGLFDLLSDVTDETGNVIDAGGRDFFDVLIEAMETIEMSFDEDGKPDLTVVLHPEQAAKLRDREPTAEQEARMNAVLERRREEWHASRRRPDLP